MQKRQFKRWWWMPILLLMAGLVTAQDAIGDACAIVLRDALDRVSACDDLAGAQTCFVNGSLNYVPREAAATFEETGDVINTSDFVSLTSSGLDVEAESYGIAVLNLTDTPMDPPRMIVLGDVLLRDVGSDAFTLRTQSAGVACDGAVNTVLVETPPDMAYVFNINGADISMAGGSVLVLTAQANQALTVYTVTGAVEITSRERTERMTLGQFTRVELGLAEGLVAVSEPAVPSRYDGDVLQAVPLRLVVDGIIEIPSASQWVATGVEVQAGDIFVLQATEFAQTGPDLPWSVAEGLSRIDCAAFGRSDWDCACRRVAEFGSCTVDSLASMKLLGRVGDSQPFVTGSGGIFRAQSAGEIFLGANDNTFEDNVGSFYVVIQVIPAAS